MATVSGTRHLPRPNGAVVQSADESGRRGRHRSRRGNDVRINTVCSNGTRYSRLYAFHGESDFVVAKRVRSRRVLYGDRGSFARHRFGVKFNRGIVYSKYKMRTNNNARYMYFFFRSKTPQRTCRYRARYVHSFLVSEKLFVFFVLVRVTFLYLTCIIKLIYMRCVRARVCQRLTTRNVRVRVLSVRGHNYKNDRYV